VFMSPDDHASMTATGGVPSHLYPEDAARALGRVMRHVEWRQGPLDAPPKLADVRPGEAAAIIAEALASGREWMEMDACARLLDCYGVPAPRWRLASDPGGAGEAAEDLGGRVALKAQGPGLLHKTEMGAVRIGLAGRDEVTRAAGEMDSAIAAAGAKRDAFIVQAMVETGVELLVGVVDDATFGPVLAAGAGGTHAELLRDVAIRICPITRAEAGKMIRSLGTFPLLTGFRGAPEADLGAIEELLLRVSAMVEAHREIAEMDLNPVVAGSDGALAIDSRIRVRTAPPTRPWPRTWK
jgi:acetate---CoA ligase (ADP-forming)